MSTFYHTNSVTQVHQFLGMQPPAHPLITIIREWPQLDFDFTNLKVTRDLFIISCKGSAGKMGYGRNTYDFQEGTLVFASPKQVLTFDDTEENTNNSGWTIFFHPDLLRKSSLGNEIKGFAFFDYAVTEALHLSEKEKQILNDFVRHIEIEINQNIDKHSKELIISNLQSILKY